MSHFQNKYLVYFVNITAGLKTFIFLKCCLFFKTFFNLTFFHQLVKSFVIIICVRVVKVHDNYAPTLITAQPVYSEQAIQRTPCNRGHFLVELAESWSNSHRKTPI